MLRWDPARRLADGEVRRLDVCRCLIYCAFWRRVFSFSCGIEADNGLRHMRSRGRRPVHKVKENCPYSSILLILLLLLLLLLLVLLLLLIP